MRLRALFPIAAVAVAILAIYLLYRLLRGPVVELEHELERAEK